MTNREAVKGLLPQDVFKIFADICSIPHGSGNTEMLREYCKEFADRLGYESICDKSGNILIRVLASRGRESESTVILQGHLDMVCEKENGCDIDFKNDGLKLIIDGEYITADGTTLGGDDGIAVAMALAIIADEATSHPALEVLFTTDEETGMYGADGFDCSLLKGKTLINLDSESESTVWVSCAGGMRANADFHIERVSPRLDKTLRVTLGNLAGGHSGSEIDKNRLNAVRALCFLLKEFAERNALEISSISGGLMDNAIVREATAVVNVADAAEFKSFCDMKKRELSEKATEADKGLTLTLDEVDPSCNVFSQNARDNILGFVTEAPNGVIKMSGAIDGLVETSLNIGITKTSDDNFHASFSLRSSVNSEKEALNRRLKACAEKFGARYETSGSYPAWEFNPVSPLRERYVGVYRRLFGEECTVEAIHAGLECGIFYDRIENLDCISVGPDMLDIHTPQERLNIRSVGKVFEVVKRVVSEQ